jgi:carboxyl-terminal processing protease
MDIPMVLLVNGYSASASELVAGAWKDYGAAYLIGTQTYGKGIVQSYFSIPETKGMLKITTEAYYTPNGVCIHGIGIEPDEVLELSEEAQKYSITVLPFELDTQLQAAIHYLETH